jgi:REP element-mobilizing transposase RayT
MVKKRGRQSIRHQSHDYHAPGFYFVTIVTHQRRKILSSIHDGQVQLSPVGMAIMRCWHDIPMHCPPVQVHDIVVMPDHIHGIIEISSLVPSHTIRGGTAKSIGSVIRCLKIGVTMQTQSQYGRIWHRNYYDRIIRDDAGLAAVKAYIRLNPIRWRDGASESRGE